MSATATTRDATVRKRRQSQKSERTRQHIIDAAIKCIAQYGYTGATLAVVAEVAGLSRGPRQYYFPSKTDLMVAVWQEIIERASQSMRNANLDADHPKESLRRLMDAEIKRSAREEYLVDLELKLAIRGDRELGDILSPLIDAFERSVDDWWIDLFAKTGRSREELLAARYQFTWLLRGLAMEKITRHDIAVSAMERQFRDTVFAVLFDE